jgi:hypothetical protein
LDIEKNIPSIYSSFAILVCSLLFSIIAYLERGASKLKCLRWLGLALVFLFLSVDEGFQLHEILGDATEDYINATGFLYFPWVVPYIVMTLIFSLFYVRFLFRLPKTTAVLLILSGTVFLTGAALFDMIGGREAELHGYDTVMYCALYTIEEFLEMIAIVGLIYALLSYIEKQFGHIYITLQVREAEFPLTKSPVKPLPSNEVESHEKQSTGY